MISRFAGPYRRLLDLPLLPKQLPMWKWFAETWHTFSVTTYHPVGWGVSRLGTKLHFRRPQRPESLVYEKAAPVLLVHGVLHNASAFYRLEKSLYAEGFSKVHSLELFTVVRSMDSLARKLKKEVKRLLEDQSQPRKVRIVAHSLGGVVARVALLDPDFALLVDKVIFLGTPHQGASYPFRLPRSLNDLHHNESLRKRLSEEPLPGKIRYWNLRGKLDFVTPGHITFLPHVPNLVFDGIGHAGLLSNPKVVQSVVEILETPAYDPKLNGFGETSSTQPQ